MVENKNQKIICSVVAYVFLTAAMLVCVLPLLMIISASLSSESDIVMTGYGIFPKGFTLDAYKSVCTNSSSLLNSYKVTIFTTVVGTALNVIITSMAAYPLSRSNYKIRRGISFYFYFTMLFSGGAIPSYLLISQYLHLSNNILVLIIPLCFSVWNCFILRTYFSKIPTALIEAAKIDGLNEIGIFFRIIIPLSGTGIATIAVLVSMGYWNEWYNCLMYMTDEKAITLQYFLYRTMSNIEAMLKNRDIGITNLSEVPSETARMAMCVLATGPMVFIFMFFQKYFAKGINVGSVKG